jgi:membrane protease YdiL (CAAX protease family)
VTEAAPALPAPAAPGPGDVPRWGLGDAAVGWLLSVTLSTLTYLLVLGATGRTAEDDLPLGLTLLASAGLWVGFIGVPIVVTRVKGHGPVADLGLAVRWIDVPVGLLIGAVAQFALLLLYAPIFVLFDKSQSDIDAPAQELGDLVNGPASAIFLIVLVAVGAPIAEELFYRGLVMRSLIKRGLSGGVSVGLTALAFAATHLRDLETWLLLLPGLVFAGLVFGVLALRTGRLGTSIAAHMGFNLVTAIALLQS